jgi:hypothetical protein
MLNKSLINSCKILVISILVSIAINAKSIETSYMENFDSTNYFKDKLNKEIRYFDDENKTIILQKYDKNNLLSYEKFGNSEKFYKNGNVIEERGPYLVTKYKDGEKIYEKSSSIECEKHDNGETEIIIFATYETFYTDKDSYKQITIHFDKNGKQGAKDIEIIKNKKNIERSRYDANNKLETETKYYYLNDRMKVVHTNYLKNQKICQENNSFKNGKTINKLFNNDVISDFSETYKNGKPKHYIHYKDGKKKVETFFDKQGKVKKTKNH